MLLGLGLAGSGTGISALVTQSHTYNSLRYSEFGEIHLSLAGVFDSTGGLCYKTGEVWTCYFSDKEDSV